MSVNRNVTVPVGRPSTAPVWHRRNNRSRYVGYVGASKSATSPEPWQIHDVSARTAGEAVAVAVAVQRASGRRHERSRRVRVAVRLGHLELGADHQDGAPCPHHVPGPWPIRDRRGCAPVAG